MFLDAFQNDDIHTMREKLFARFYTAGGDGHVPNMWQEHAMRFLEALFMPLSYLVEFGILSPKFATLHDYLELPHIENLAWSGVVSGGVTASVDLKEGDARCQRLYRAVIEKCRSLRRYLERLSGRWTAGAEESFLQRERDVEDRLRMLKHHRYITEEIRMEMAQLL
ncbi:hypothetical protein [Saccharibacter floricola]|uniref:Uncharacterized protein n=1 Tax=Saccharibacter floricola DSM 15669 TaxID=1123227 RepID=A0ABQ0NWX2_9PROT|nr:hypothetical protein [Saccharibacter floricola]GBQ05018.1 hypothetical protein AA15669_0263 [Saccharibacter floricola DSM 15669]